MTEQFENTTLKGRGRHDPCVLPRAVPMVEAMTALVLVDHALRQQGAMRLIFFRNRRNFIQTEKSTWLKKTSTKFRATRGCCSPRPTKRRSGKIMDYAIALFNQVLEKEPAFYECRKALRAAQFKKAGSGGGGFFKKMMSGAGSSPQVAKAKMALGKNPAEAMAIAEQILNGDPNNSAAHRIIVDAATALELPHTAVLSYETLSNNSPKDRNLAIEFAKALAAAGDVSAGENNRGEKILMDLLRDNPNDGELEPGVEKSVRAQDDGPGRLQRARRRQRFLPRHVEEQGRSRFARTGKPRRENRERHRAAHRRIRDAPANRAGQLEAHALARRTLHAEKPVRPRRWRFTTASKIPRWAATRRSNAPLRRPSCAGSIFRLRATQSVRAGPRRAGGENPGGEIEFSTGRMPEARGKISDRPAHPV